MTSPEETRDMNMEPLSEETRFAMEFARDAGQVFLQHFGHSQAEWKADNTPVTEADHAINDLFIQRISEQYPGDAVYGEESSTDHTAERVWTVDPIDGTQAFDTGIPLSTIVVSLNEQGIVRNAVIFVPISNTMFVAEKGRGAYKNEQPIHVNGSNQVGQNYFATSSRMPEGFATSGQIHDRIEAEKGKDYNFRSYAYCATKVAEGVFSGCVLGNGRSFDTSAPALLIEEAGGKATDLSGNPLDFINGSNGIVLTNGTLHDKFLGFVQQ